MTLDKIKDRIRKLLAVAGNDAATDGEKSNALRMASAMMRKHNIERDDVKEEEFVRVTCNCKGKRMTRWESAIGYNVSQVVPSVFVVQSGPSIVFVGSKDDAELAGLIFSDWTTTAYETAIRRFNSWARGKGASYCLGYSAGINERIEESQVKDIAEHSHAIIDSNARAYAIRDNAKRWLSKDVKIGSGRRSTASNVDTRAYNAGVNDGRNQSTPTARQQPRFA